MPAKTKRTRIGKGDFVREYLASSPIIMAARYNTTVNGIVGRANRVNSDLFDLYEKQGTPEKERFFLPIPEGKKRGAKTIPVTALASLVAQLMKPPAPTDEGVDTDLDDGGDYNDPTDEGEEDTDPTE